MFQPEQQCDYRGNQAATHSQPRHPRCQPTLSQSHRAEIQTITNTLTSNYHIHHISLTTDTSSLFNIIIYLRVLCRWRANMWLSRPFGNQWQCGAGGGAQSRQVQCHSLGQHQAGWEGGREGQQQYNQHQTTLPQHSGQAASSTTFRVLGSLDNPDQTLFYIFFNIEFY